MDKKELKRVASRTKDFIPKLGEVLYDAIQEDDNYTCDMAEGVINVINMCSTPEEFSIADAMLIAICGYSIETLVEEIKDRNKKHYHWNY